MIFTASSYKKMLDLLSDNQYIITNYFDWTKYNKCVVLRHDIDIDLQHALLFARAEYEYGIKSTYFVLLTSNFYNPYSKKNRKLLSEIKSMGHTIGLHFDEMTYPKDIGNVERTTRNIKKEMDMLSGLLEEDVTCFSYHRPSKIILDSDIEIEGFINSYGSVFLKQFKYLSDSRMHWREPVLDIIKRNAYNKLHILTHPFWYYDTERSMKEIIENYLFSTVTERYDNLDENFTKLNEVLSREDIEKV